MTLFFVISIARDISTDFPPTFLSRARDLFFLVVFSARYTYMGLSSLGQRMFTYVLISLVLIYRIFWGIALFSSLNFAKTVKRASVHARMSENICTMRKAHKRSALIGRCASIIAGYLFSPLSTQDLWNYFDLRSTLASGNIQLCIHRNYAFVFPGGGGGALAGEERLRRCSRSPHASTSGIVINRCALEARYQRLIQIVNYVKWLEPPATAHLLFNTSIFELKFAALERQWSRPRRTSMTETSPQFLSLCTDSPDFVRCHGNWMIEPVEGNQSQNSGDRFCSGLEWNRCRRGRYFRIKHKFKNCPAWRTFEIIANYFLTEVNIIDEQTLLSPNISFLSRSVRSLFQKILGHFMDAHRACDCVNCVEF